MIIREFSPIPYKGGKLPFQDLLQAILRNGLSWPAEMKSQDVVTSYLSRSLDNTYTLLRNVSLPDTEITIPLLLVGPTGVTVINNNPAKGIYRAQSNSWRIMSSRSGSFQDAKPNLVTRTILFTRAVETYLTEKNFSEIPVEGVLVLTNPGTHVDTTKPDVRIVLIDGLERLGAQIYNKDPIVDHDIRYNLIKSVERGYDSEELEITPSEPSSRELSQSIDTGFDQAISPMRRRINFSRRQWFMLGAFVIAEVVILVIFLIMIMTTA